MTLLKRVSHDLTMAVSRPMVRRRLVGVEGLEHLPLDGPCVLVSNHLSFADHFVYEALVFAVRGEQAAFLTKAESFTGLRSTWFDSVGAVPVDRSRPAREVFEITDRVFGSGRVLVVYPEGTRNPRPPMLDFKDGGFRFADRAQVPVIPAALWGAQDVLPIGGRVPRSGRIRVVFGPPLLPDPELPRAARIRDLTERGRAAVGTLLERATEPLPPSAADMAERTSALAETVLERGLSGVDTTHPRIRRKQAALLLRIARHLDPDNTAARTGTVRLRGLRAMDAPQPFKAFGMFQVRAAAQRLLREDADNLMAHYVMGRWHLLMPGVMGGRPDRAVEHLACAERLGGTDSRYAMAHAEALLAAGRRAQAAAALDRVIAAPVPDQRTRLRRERAVALRERDPDLSTV
ncbi:lysophospholipid acyltransferase family protein [Streptomyces sp. NPDC056485]|uniref:lysophospholipid acyltransferase family protein n=1 Tax=Streptomyces sp. NPDC056485 TaxID=3345834 RepID=UPI0036BF1AD6